VSIEKEVWTYSRKGILKHDTHFVGSNVPFGRYEGSCDSKGNVVEALYYDGGASGVLKEQVTYKYTYDKHGNWIQRVMFQDGKAKYVVKRGIVYW
jgi:YD repeat-containing protein